ncbi:MAG: ATP-binding cassette domain-containing protein [Chloroflexota bacterium]|nr:ATP-binding cassette domain-containing protein [Chloroflexota bacterium]
MSIIQFDNVVKEFRTARRRPGLLGTVRTLFTREYDVKRAVAGISFGIGEGELVGYLGENGAGKSTTIKMLTGILVPTSGEVEVAGLVPWRARERNALNIGVVFGQRSQLWWDLPLIESFKLVAKLYRIEQSRYERNLGRFREILGLDEFLHSPVRQLSLGQRMRGDLAAAMLYDPRIVYLDEPTIGLDVLAKERIRVFIEEMNREQGTTIVLTTHDLGDVERLCRRVLLIDRGRLLYDGPLARLKAEYAPHRVLVVQLAPDAVERAADGAPGDAPAIDAPGTEFVKQEDGRVWLRFDPAATPVPSLIAGITARYPVSDLSIEEPDLEPVIRQIYEERRVRL